MSDLEKREELLRNHQKKTRWSNFELEVYEAVRIAIAENRLMLSPASAKVLHKPAYFSRDRRANIIFDVAIEAYADGASTPSLIWPWECKDYPTRKVKVDEIEEFHAKMMQVRAGKGTVVTRVGFESGATEFAKSKNIGLATLQKKLRYVTCFSADTPTYEHVIMACQFGQKANGTELPADLCLTIGDFVHMELRESGYLR